MMIRILLALLAIASSASAAEPVRVAIIGLTHDHVFWLLGRPKDRGDIEIVAVVEPNEELAAERMADAGLDASLHYTDLDTMLVDVRPDAAVLFGSIREHHPHALACLKAGAHVMVEKPLATTLEQAEEMAAAAKRVDRQLLTNYETTWYRSVHALRAECAKNDFGKLRRMTFRMGHRGPIEIGCRQVFLDWLLDPVENGGGALADFGCYGANLATWVRSGERPLSVSCVTKQMKPRLYPDVDDDATVTIEYSEAVAVVQASWNWPHNVKEMRAYGERGELVTRGADALQVRNHQGVAKTRNDLPPLAADEAEPFAHFAAVVRGDCQPNALSSVENNLIVVEILDAARRSAETGQRVVLPR